MTRRVVLATGAVRQAAMAQAVRQEERERGVWRAAIEGAASREEIAVTVWRAARAVTAPRVAIREAVPPQAIVKTTGEMVRRVGSFARGVAPKET